MSDDEGRGIRRILIAIDTSPHSLEALRAAIYLASRMDAELLGLYVEDIQLIQMAELPLVRQVSTYSGEAGEVDRERVERQLRAEAAQARRVLRDMAERERLRFDFRVARGLIAVELLQAAEEADLIILGKSGWSGRRRLGSTTRILIDQTPRHTLIIQHGRPLRHPLGIFYDGSDSARQALVLASHLLKGEGEPFILLILAESIEQAQAFSDEAAALLHSQEMEASARWIVGSPTTRLMGLLRLQGLGGLILPARLETFPEDALPLILDQLDIPVLLVR